MRADAGGIPFEDAAPRLVHAHVADAVQRRIEEIDDPADWLEHGRIVHHSMRGRKPRRWRTADGLRSIRRRR